MDQHSKTNEAVKPRDDHRDEELRKLVLERARDIRDLNEQLSRRDEQLGEARVDLAGIAQERDDCRRQLSELGPLVTALRAELDGQRRHAANLEAGLAGRDDRIRWLEGVLDSLKNRLPHKVYESSTYWLKRLLVQVPLLAALYLLNFASNLYLQWWTHRHQQQLFPGT